MSEAAVLGAVLIGGVIGAPFGHLAALGIWRGVEWWQDRRSGPTAGVMRAVFLPAIGRQS